MVYRAGVQGGYGTRVGRGRVIPVPSTLLGEEVYPAKRAPEAPARGLEWVGYTSGRPVPYGPPLPAVGPAPLSIWDLLEQVPHKAV